MEKYKTWVEIKKSAIHHNIKELRSLLKPRTQLWAVVKSNAYGHGLLPFSKASNVLSVSGFCIDSVTEGLALRNAGIKKPVLVLGPTLSSQPVNAAAQKDLTLTIANFEALRLLKSVKKPSKFHVKIDTGMHRQGFSLKEIPSLIKSLKMKTLVESCAGLYTHFASAKDINYPAYTDYQFSLFKKAAQMFERAGFKNLLKHAAATGGTLVNASYHCDAVRSGIGLYGLWPSKELEFQRPDIRLKPVLSWHALISEIKTLKKGDYIGYDLAERAVAPIKVAIIPIGYWHGFPRALSGIGEVLIRGRRAKVLGRVSMDLIAVNANQIPCAVNDRITLIGWQKRSEISASEFAQKFGTTHYEAVTRINPLIERIVT